MSVYGTTPETKSTSECGMGAIGDYMGSFIGEVSCSANGFNSFYSDFKSYGYKSGLTIQAMPYDWRRPAYYNDLQFRLERTVKFMRQLTGNFNQIFFNLFKIIKASANLKFVKKNLFYVLEVKIYYKCLIDLRRI